MRGQAGGDCMSETAEGMSAEGFVDPIIGWMVVFPKDGSLAELLYRDEAAARRAAEGSPEAVVSSFSTPDASWHRWEDRPD